MPRDYAKRRRKRRRNSSKKAAPAAPVALFCAGVLVGFGLALLACWGLPLLPRDLPLPAAPAGQAGAEAVEKDAKQPVLDFYTRLKKREGPEVAGPPSPAGAGYLLQAGSFRSAAEADSARARLILLNLTAEIEVYSHHDETWHRVLVGPFASRAGLDEARALLRDNGIDSLVLELIPNAPPPAP
ncbi:MAG: SPOR domain-containing protein [Cellvibrionales bacterium]|nr:SPOR domain-containing protein [Cellvibrionales bacterium]